MERPLLELDYKYIDTFLNVVPEHSENLTPFASNKALPPILDLDKWLATAQCFQYEFYQKIDEEVGHTLQNNPPICLECYYNTFAEATLHLFSPVRPYYPRRHLKYFYHFLRINSESSKVLCSICLAIIDPIQSPATCVGCSMVLEYIKSIVSHGHAVIGSIVEIPLTQRAVAMGPTLLGTIC